MHKLAGESVRILLKSFDHRVLELSATHIRETVESTGAKVAGPVPLPTSKRMFTVIRGPHIDKRSREHFRLYIHKRLMDIYEASPNTVDALTRLVLPAGVDVVVKS